MFFFPLITFPNFFSIDTILRCERVLIGVDVLFVDESLVLDNLSSKEKIICIYGFNFIFYGFYKITV